jgi:pimeloyl-ACP methyl ester carboxylesterase
VVPLLEERGHRALAPDLAGMGQDRTPRASVTLAMWGEQIASLVAAQPEPVVLVGHSRGGIVLSEAAERVPDRIRRLIYLTAVLVPDGRSLASVMGETVRATPFERTVNPDGSTTVANAMVGERFYNTTAPQWVERAASLLGPEPPGAFAVKLSLTPERFGRVPRAYIECLRDRALTIETQRAMQRLVPCDPVLALDTDHSPFYSAPEALVACLEDLARRPTAGGVSS